MNGLQNVGFGKVKRYTMPFKTQVNPGSAVFFHILAHYVVSMVLFDGFFLKKINVFNLEYG